MAPSTAMSPSTTYPTPWTSMGAATCRDHHCPLRTRAHGAMEGVSVPGAQGPTYVIQGVGQSGCPGGHHS